MKLYLTVIDKIFIKLNKQQLLITDKAIRMAPNSNTKTKIHSSINQAIEKLSLPKPLQGIQKWLNEPKSKTRSTVIKRNKKNAVLFYGSKTSGKYIIATMLANQAGKELYKVDLSKIVSKYIGETEKNLSAIFQRAKDKEWILFFDEADALFGKRTNVRDSHDRYANQEVSYLLQKIEEHNGLVFLSTNKKTNIDQAFMRRLRYVIDFPFPEK